MGNPLSTGGVEVVTKNLISKLLNANLPIWGIIATVKQSQKEKEKYLSDNKNFKIIFSPIEEINEILKKNKITHLIIQQLNIKEIKSVIEIIDNKEIRIIPFLHGTPNIYLQKFSFNNNWLTKAKNYIKDLIGYKSKIAKNNISIFNYILENCFRFIIVSNQSKAELIKITQKEHQYKIQSIYNIVPIIDSNANSKENIIISAGRLVYNKGVYHSLPYIAKVMKQFPSWKYLIIGNGPEYEKINSYITKHNCTNIFLLGETSNDRVHYYLRRSKICLLYSLYEGLPTILIEAGKYNNALIAYKSPGGGGRDIISQNINGFIVKNHNEIQNILTNLLSNPHLLAKIANGNAKIISKFDEQEIIKKWCNILN